MSAMEKNLLITAVGGDIGCTALRCIINSYDYNVIIGCDIVSDIEARLYLDKFFIAPPYSDEEQYIEYIMDVCIKYSVTHLLPMSEQEIVLINKHRDWFGKNNVLLLVNKPLILDIALSKYKTASFLSEQGISVPKTYRLDEYTNQLSYPLVIKADYSRGSKDVKIVNNDEEYCNSIAQIYNPIIQEYIGTPDDEYTMCIFSDGTQVSSITFKRKLGFGGMSVKVELVCDEKLNYISNQIAKSFRLVGSINVQMRKESGEYYVFEINPRISSSIGFRHLFGFKDLIWWLSILDGKKVDLNYQVPDRKIGIRTLGEVLLPDYMDETALHKN